MDDVAKLLQAARDVARLDQRDLAARSGIAQATISRIERGSVSPRMATLDKLLAGCGVQMRIELEPLHIDVDREIDAMLALTPAQRWDAVPFEVRIVLEQLAGAGGSTGTPMFAAFPDLARVTAQPGWADDIPYAVDGTAAALLLGAPVRPGHLDVVVQDDDGALERFAAALSPLHPRRAVGERGPDLPRGQEVAWGQPLITVDLPRGGGARWLTVHGEVRTVLEAANPLDRAVRITAAPVGRPIPVLPAYEIGPRAPETALALDRLVQRQRG